MQKSKRWLAVVLSFAMLGSSFMTGTPLEAKKKTTGFRISKDAGTYTGKVSVTVKAKKGYTVYYTTGKKLSSGKKIKSKKEKTFTFSKTKTVRIYATKKKLSKKALKKISIKKMKSYRYKIVKKGLEGNVTPDLSGDVTANMPLATAGNSEIPTNTPGVIPTGMPIATPGDSQYTGDDSSSDYIEPVRIEYDDEDSNVSEEEATAIDLTSVAPSKKISTDNYEISKKNKLTIIKPGTYVVSTEEGQTVDGLIEVDYADDAATEATHLILKGVSLTSSNNTEPTSDTGLITVKKSVSNAKVILTMAEGTVNTLMDTGETGVDKDDSVSTTYTAGIVCKKTPLTINGTGTLNIVSTNGNGIKCTGSMKIKDVVLNVSGPDEASTGHNGVTAKLGLGVKDAKMSIHSNGDALKTTLDEDDVKEDASLAEQGNMDIDGGEYTLVSENGDGISAYRTLYLNPKVLTVTTKNAAQSTEDSSYKGIKAGVTIYVPQTAGTITADTQSTYQASRASGDSNDPYADDTIHCDGYIKIDGGIFRLAAGDDAVHSDIGLVINGGTFDICDSYEGLESGDITINGGTINIKSRDDGMNAAGGKSGTDVTEPGRPGDGFYKGDSASTSNYQIIINEGEITIDADGDGIDSNGNIFFKGGTVTVNGSTNAGNGALDYGDSYDCVCEISGGTLIAAGAVGMDVAPTSGSSQPAVNVRLATIASAGTYVVLKDDVGNAVLTAQPTKQFQSVVMSSPELELGKTYTVYYGSDLDSLTQGDSVTFTGVSMSTGSSFGGWGNPGGQWGPRK